MQASPEEHSNGTAQGRQHLPVFRQNAPRSFTAHAIPFFKNHALLLIALAVYLFIRLVALPQFPIYFFTDEAIQSVHAADLLRDNLRGEDGELLPTYFPNGGQYNLSVSVYLQVLPVLIFGKSIWITRGIGVLVSLLAAGAIGLMVRQVFRLQWGWLAVLLLSLTPAWFLHSRTAFETTLAVSFYAVFLYCYARYRQGKLVYLYAAALFAGLAFYSYSPAQVVVAFSLAGLFFSDLGYHWKNRRTLFKALAVGLLLLVPYVRFQINHPGESMQHLEILQSYLMQQIPLYEKLAAFFNEYLRGLDPRYWFLPNHTDIPRHVMGDYGHLWRPAFPFLLVGLGVVLSNLKDSRNRMLLISLLAAPAGAALVHLGITRALFMVIPTCLLGVLGFSWTIQRVKTRLKAHDQAQVFRPAGLALLFLGMSWLNIHMLTDALRSGPLWFTEYGLFAMQYGAGQVFPALAEELEQNPQTEIILSPNWANGTDIVARFFFEDPLPFEFGSIDGFINEYRPIKPETLFVMLPEEIEEMQASGKFKDFQVERTIAYPNGETGFTFARLQYMDDIAQRFAEELALRRTPVQETVTLQNGHSAAVRYSPLDMGEIRHIFDGDDFTLARTWEANPFQIDVALDTVLTVNALQLRVGGERTRIEIVLWDESGELIEVLIENLEETPDPRTVLLPLEVPFPLKQAEIRVKNVDNQEPAHVHLWEVAFLSQDSDQGVTMP